MPTFKIRARIVQTDIRCYNITAVSEKVAKEQISNRAFADPEAEDWLWYEHIVGYDEVIFDDVLQL